MGLQWTTFAMVSMGVTLVAFFFLASSRTETTTNPLQPSYYSSSHSPSLIFQNRRQQKVKAFDFHGVLIKEAWATAHYEENGVPTNMTLYFMGSNTEPPFIATLADPAVEAASKDAYKNDDMEIPTRLMFQYLLQHNCSKRPNGYLVIDAGANLGYFSTYSGAMGCRVAAIEPQPRLHPIIRTSAQVNNLEGRLVLYPNIISDNPDDRLLITYVKSACWGCSSVRPAKEGEKSDGTKFVVNATRIDMVAHEDVLLMKVDVEGYEVVAIESAENIFAKYTIHNILIEWNAKRWPHGLDRANKLLERLYDMGYTIRHYNLRMKIPRELVFEEKTFPIIGKTWEIPKIHIAQVNEFLKNEDKYGEANLWLSKER